MNFGDIITVTKRELRSAFSNKTTLFQIVVVPFIVIFGYILLMSSMTSGAAEGSSKDDDKLSSSDSSAYCMNVPDFMTDDFKALGFADAADDKLDSIKDKISEGDNDILVVFPEDFTIAENGDADLSDIQIWFNSNETDSEDMYTQVLTYLDRYRPMVFTVNADENGDYDLANDSDFIRKMLSSILPAIIIMAIFMVGMNISAESIAGDKERGFLNTMLIAPVKRSSIAFGKTLYILIISSISAISAYIGLILALPKFVDSFPVEDVKFSFSVNEYLSMFFVTLSGVVAISCVLLIVSALSNTVKQATTITPFFMLILIIPSMLTMSDSISQKIENFGIKNSFIPAWNSVVTMQNVINCDYTAKAVIVSTIVNIVFAVLLTWIIGRIFEDEKIING